MRLFLIMLMVLSMASVRAQNESGHDSPGDHDVHGHALHEQTITISDVQLYNLGVKIGPLVSNNEVPLLNAPGKVVIPPANDHIVSAAQAGLITQLLVAVGDRVEQGQLLAEISSPELLTLERQYLKALSNRQLAWSAYQRDKKLAEQGVIAKRRWLETQSRYQLFDAEVDEARQLLEFAGMSDSDIKQLSKTRKLTRSLNVYAPIDGVVLERMITVGNRVDTLAPLYRVANLERLWLEINIPHERAEHIKLGDKVLIANSTANARVSLIGRRVDPENQTLLTRAVVDRSDHYDLHAGQSVNARVLQSSQFPLFKVPNAAIAQREGQAYIFIRHETGFAIAPVDILGKQQDFAIVAGDLHGDENIAIRGAVALKAKWVGLGETETEGGHEH